MALRKKLATDNSEENKMTLLKVADEISEMCAEENVEKIRNQVNNISNLQGGFSSEEAEER